MKRMHIAHTVSAALTVALMALPFGVNCYYASASDATGIDFSTVQAVSFFDVRLFDFNNPLPFFTALLAVALLAVSVYRLFDNTASAVLVRAVTVLSAVLAVLMVLPLILYGTEYFTTIAMTAAFLALCMTTIGAFEWKGIQLFPKKEPLDEE